MKKIVSALLTVILVLGMLSGCSNKSGGKVTLKWGVPVSFAGQSDTKIVLESFNEKLQKAMPGVSIELVAVDPETWSQKMAAGEEYDIVWTGYSYDMATEIAQGSYLELDDLITEKETPNLYKEKEEFAAAYETATEKGSLYAIPNEQPIIAETSILKIPESLFQYFDAAAFTKACWASPKTTREVYDIIDSFLEKCWANDAVDTDMVSNSIDPLNLYDFIAKRGYDFIDTNSNICYEAFDESGKIYDFSQTDAYKLWLEYAGKWYEKGYISQNVLVSGGSSGSRLSVLTAHSKGMWYNVPDNGVMEVYDTYGDLEQYYVNMEPKDLSQNYNGISKLGSEATYTAIPYTTKHEKEAIQLIDLLRSPKGTLGNELLNLLVYGFEKNSDDAAKYGKYHYTLNGDEIQSDEYAIQPDSKTSYGIPHWIIGNVYLTYRTSNILEGQNEYATDYINRMKEAHKTKYCGFRFDISSISVQRSNIASVVAEYEKRLVCGVNGKAYDNLYKEFTDKLKTAGIETVIETANKQTESFLKDK